MEVIKRRRPPPRKFEDSILIEKPGQGFLIIEATSENFIQVGDVRIYLHQVRRNGKDGGVARVALRFQGPREIEITRHERGTE